MQVLRVFQQQNFENLLIPYFFTPTGMKIFGEKREILIIFGEKSYGGPL
jgi:hypothetical protein